MAAQVEAIFESKEADRWLSQIQKRFADAEKGSRELGGIIASTVFQDIIDHFENELGEYGKWQKWSTSYAAQMRRLGKSGNKKLKDIGRLRNSFSPSNYKPSGGGVLFFNRAVTNQGFPYAYAHDTGGPKLPQRQFMWASPGAMEQIAELTLNWLADVD